MLNRRSFLAALATIAVSATVEPIRRAIDTALRFTFGEMRRTPNGAVYRYVRAAAPITKGSIVAWVGNETVAPMSLSHNVVAGIVATDITTEGWLQVYGPVKVTISPTVSPNRRVESAARRNAHTRCNRA